MKWWRRYCCCCCPGCRKSPSDDRLLNDSSSSSLMQQQQQQQQQQQLSTCKEASFCIPRRHSSFHSADAEGSLRCRGEEDQQQHHYSSSSSSGDEDEDHHQRGRSWSTVPPPTADAECRASKKKSRSCSFSTSSTSSSNREKVSFDKHILTEIAETTEEEPKQQAANDVCGLVTFTTAYDERELRVFVERASNLPRKSPQETYNTFVKMSIIFSNHKNTTTTSRTIKNTLSPVYREDHVFHTNRSKSTNQKTCLRLSLFDCDRQGRHDAIGHALLPLSQLSAKKQKHSLPLTPMSIPTKKNLGQVLVGLSYLPTQSLLCVQVMKARHLTLDSDIHKRPSLHKDTLDTFVKVSLMCAGQKVKSNASRVVFGTSDPFYHFKNTFVLPPQFMLDASIVVSVVVRGILGRSFTLGRVISGPYTELSDGTHTHWGKMVQENRNIVQWRNLYL